jgi:hypothetical protein
MNWKELPCFQHVHWNPAQKELRSFAKAMLIGFAVLGLLVAWRRHGIGTPTLVLWTIGVALAAAAMIPVLGKIAYLAVYIPTGIIGFFVSRIILTLVFFLVFTPLGLLLRLLGKDPLHLKKSVSATEWIAHPEAGDRKRFYRQF